jgi:hypothetical protein
MMQSESWAYASEVIVIGSGVNQAIHSVKADVPVVADSEKRT